MDQSDEESGLTAEMRKKIQFALALAQIRLKSSANPSDLVFESARSRSDFEIGACHELSFRLPKPAHAWTSHGPQDEVLQWVQYNLQSNDRGNINSP